MPVAAAACLIVHYLEQVAQQDTPSSHLPIGDAAITTCTSSSLRTSASWTDGDQRLSKKKKQTDGRAILIQHTVHLRSSL